MISEPRQRTSVSPSWDMAADGRRSKEGGWCGTRKHAHVDVDVDVGTLDTPRTLAGWFGSCIGLDSADRNELSEAWVLGKEIFVNCSLSETLVPVSIMRVARFALLLSHPARSSILAAVLS